jgi:hypothetical protein
MESKVSERLWILVHSDLGPYLVATWYRPPVQGEVESIRSFKEELTELKSLAIGTLIVGDLNIHHKRWLKYSARNSAEGEELHRICLDAGLKQHLQKPTRDKHLLDLVIADIDGLQCKVLPKIADHCCVTACMKFSVPVAQVIKRRVWNFARADWNQLRTRLATTDWYSIMAGKTADEAAMVLTDTVLAEAEECIPRKVLHERKSTHPWVNKRVLDLVKEKHAAEGKPDSIKVIQECSKGIREEFWKYVASERDKLKKQSIATKGWWSNSRRLLQQRGKTCSIPPLKAKDGQWCKDPKSKADLLAESFKTKGTLADKEINHYSDIEPEVYQCQSELNDPTEEHAEQCLTSLRSDSGTGPDDLPTRILKNCARELAKPVCMLARLILQSGRWPQSWTLHWIVALFKKGAMCEAKNYRGVHLTTQLSKVMERLLRPLFVPFLVKHDGFGPNQFAYMEGRGARDAIAFMLLRWIEALVKRRKVAIYCSDVAGAFDRVNKERLLAKLAAKKVHPKVIAVIKSWLRSRKATVVVGGMMSDEFELSDAVFQGTVWGPPLWNTFYEDARRAIQETFFEEIVFADDLNSFRMFPGTTPNDRIIRSMQGCQAELHSWGEANQVSFDPEKESFHILSNTEPFGEEFKLLGVSFDTTLSMESAVQQVTQSASWKLKMLIKTMKYYNTGELVMLYKAHLLSFLEYRTPALYHATREVLEKLDRVQDKFLDDAGIDGKEALLHFNLAPLDTRRDIAMLGVLHRTSLGKGPKHFKEYFKPAQGNLLEDPRDTLGRSRLVQRSAFGLVAVYNILPAQVRAKKSVQAFQTALQNMVKDAAGDGIKEWRHMLSPRLGMEHHPLKVYGEIWTTLV